MSLFLFLLGLYALTIYAATEKAPTVKRKKNDLKTKLKADRDCAVSFACLQAFKSH